MKFIRNHFIFLAIIACYLGIQYISFFTGNHFVLGGEGLYWLDFGVYLRKSGLTWQDIGIGVPTTSLNTSFIFAILMRVIGNERLISFLVTAASYCLPFSAMYALLIRIDPKHRPTALAGAAFFVVNPFSVTFLGALNPWGIHTLFVYPLYMLIFLVYFDRNLYLFTAFGVISLLLAYTFTNPPQMLLIVGSLPVMLLIAQLILRNKISLPELITKIVVVYAALFVFHLWWIVHWAIALPDTTAIYTASFARTWLIIVSNDIPHILKDIFSYLWLIPKTPEASFLTWYLSRPYIKILMFIPFFVIVYSFIDDRLNTRDRRVMYLLMLLVFGTILLLKGYNPPFPSIILYCFDYIPFCNLFKTAPEKFGTIFVFLSAMALFYAVKSSRRPIITILVYGYIGICALPFITGSYIPLTKIDFHEYSSRAFTDYPEFVHFRTMMAGRHLEGRVLSLPTGGNYQVMMYLSGEKFYTGIDPLLANIPQSFIADYSGDLTSALFTTIDHTDHEKLLSLYSIRYIMINKRLKPWFGNLTGKPLVTLQAEISAKYREVWHEGDLYLYETKDFMPMIYATRSVAITSSPITDMPSLTSAPDSGGKTQFFTYQNKGREKTLEGIGPTDIAVPDIEFRRINATRYNIVVHHAQPSFALVFNMAYNTKWGLYAVDRTALRGPGATEVRITDDSRDRASEDEVKRYRQAGILTGSPNGELPFISKSFHQTIQNDMLPPGSLTDTWFAANTPESRFLVGNASTKSAQIPEGHHLIANGYANAWSVDPQSICAATTSCTSNPDGTYDMNLVLEYWPQRAFVVTAAISSLAVIISLGCIMYVHIRQRRR